jgi:hypothetical protein
MAEALYDDAERKAAPAVLCLALGSGKQAAGMA